MVDPQLESLLKDFNELVVAKRYERLFSWSEKIREPGNYFEKSDLTFARNYFEDGRPRLLQTGVVLKTLSEGDLNQLESRLDLMLGGDGKYGRRTGSRADCFIVPHNGLASKFASNEKSLIELEKNCHFYLFTNENKLAGFNGIITPNSDLVPIKFWTVLYNMKGRSLYANLTDVNKSKVAFDYLTDNFFKEYFFHHLRTDLEGQAWRSVAFYIAAIEKYTSEIKGLSESDLKERREALYKMKDIFRKTISSTFPVAPSLPDPSPGNLGFIEEIIPEKVPHIKVYDQGFKDCIRLLYNDEKTGISIYMAPIEISLGTLEENLRLESGDESTTDVANDLKGWITNNMSGDKWGDITVEGDQNKLSTLRQKLVELGRLLGSTLYERSHAGTKLGKDASDAHIRNIIQ